MVEACLVAHATGADVNFRSKNIINGHLLVPLRAKEGGFAPENRVIGFVSAGNEPLAPCR